MRSETVIVAVLSCCIGICLSSSVEAGSIEEIESVVSKGIPGGVLTKVTGDDHGGFSIRIVSMPHAKCLENIAAMKINLKSLSLRGDYDAEPDAFDFSLLTNCPLEDLDVSSCNVTNYASLGELPLKRLRLAYVPQLQDVSFLAGSETLEFLDVSGTAVSRLDPLSGVKGLQGLVVDDTRVSNLTPLRDIRLQLLSVRGTAVGDLSPIADMPLTELYASGTAVSKIAVLAGMPLKRLSLGWSAVTNVAALRELKLELLDIEGCAVKDLDPIRAIPLVSLCFDPHYATNGLSGIQKIKTLEEMDCRMWLWEGRRMPMRPQEFWERYRRGSLDCHPLTGDAFPYRRHKPKEVEREGFFERVPTSAPPAGIGVKNKESEENQRQPLK